MNIHTAVLPDGTNAKRTSENRTYTHLVAVHYRGGRYDYNVKPAQFIPDGTTFWKAESWSGSQALAIKAAAPYQRTGRVAILDVQVLPCQVTVHTQKSRKPAADGGAL